MFRKINYINNAFIIWLLNELKLCYFTCLCYICPHKKRTLHYSWLLTLTDIVSHYYYVK